MTDSDHPPAVSGLLSEREVKLVRVPVTNLPAPLTPLIGRERELADASGILRRPEVRFLTLAGPGGVGKTRLGIGLAREVIRDFPEGVCFVSLAPIRDPDLIVSAVAQTLGLKEAGEKPLLEHLKSYLRDRRLLLVLDNFEHVTQAAPVVTELLSGCPDLKVLVTSRTALRISGEHEYPVPSLAMPDPDQSQDPGELQRYESVALFAERARAAKPDYQLTGNDAWAVAGICARLDGLPLAIELAAARVKLLPPQAMLSRLEKRLPLLTGGARNLPERQRTLTNTLRWSHDLLDENEKQLFRRLSVFVGGCTLQAVETICEMAGDPPIEMLEALEALISKSLLRAEDCAGAEPRFTMLQTIREYATGRLEASGEAEEVRRAHAGHYLRLAEEAEPRLWGPGQAAQVKLLEAEQGNLRAAMSWSLQREDLKTAVGLGWALWRFWWIHGQLTEGRRRMEEALAQGADLSASLRAKALSAAGTMATGQSDHTSAEPMLEESLALFRELGDRRGITYALGSYGIAAARQGHHQRGILCFTEAAELFQEAGTKWGVGFMLVFQAMAWLGQGVPARAKPLVERGLELFREVDDIQGTSVALYTLAVVVQASSEHERAKGLFEEGLSLSSEAGDKTIVAHCLDGLAATAASEGGSERAARLWGAAEALLETTEVTAYPYTPDPSLYRSHVSSARARLGEEMFEAAWSEGRAMSAGQAAEYAWQRSPEPPTTQEAPCPDAAGLSVREVEVLRLVAEGLTDAQVAESLYVSPRTVGNHLRSIYRKLGVTSRTAAARRTVENRLV